MEANARQTRAYEGAQPASHNAPTENILCHGETTYWGIVCRTCQELVAFDVSPYISFGPKAASMKPGAIRCAHGHNHIYFPRDFQFVLAAVPIPAAVMEENRKAWGAINPTLSVSSSRPEWPAAQPQAIHQVPAPQGDQPSARKSGKPPTSQRADPRRETARAAAKHRWSNWAFKKVT